MQRTLEQYDEILRSCRTLFYNKSRDYGTSWRILRITSLTDQLYIKAKRIRSLEEKREQKVQDDVRDDYMGLVNYSIIACIQLELGDDEETRMDTDELMSIYDRHAKITRELMIRKNHDYGEVWRDLRISSITDLILMKLLRIKEIEDNEGKTLVSEGLLANFQDIINYAIFALIRMEENQSLVNQ